jgi:AAA domain
MNMYQPTSETASENLPAPYDFRRDFESICRPAMIRYLRHLGYDPDEPSDGFDDCGDAARAYATSLWRQLKWAQKFPRLTYGITTWSRESAVEFTNTRLDWMIESDVPDEPIDIYRAVHLGTEMAREQGYACEPEAIAFAADRLKSKIERDAVENGEVCVHDGILTYYQWMKPQAERCQAEGRGDGKVVYVDWRKRKAEKAAQKEAKAPQPQAKPSKFALTWLTDIKLNLADEWLFKGLVPKVGVVSLFGESRGFKTFILIHMAVRGARGQDFGGHRCKNPGAFVYVAAEDARGVEKRLIGYCMKHGIERSDVPIAIIRVAPNLGTVKGDADVLGSTIRADLSAMGYGNPSGIIIDTLNQTLGDSEENGTGMQAFLINATKLAGVFDCAVFAANHVGHSEKDRERGGSQIGGNSDSRLQVERIGEPGGKAADAKTFEALITAHKVKNGEDGFSLKVTLRKFVLGVDEDGDEATTLVVDHVEAVEPGCEPKPVGKASTKTERARRGFVEAYHHLSNDVEPTPGLDGKSKVRKVKVGDLRDHMRDCGMLDRWGDNSNELTPSAKTLFSTVKAELLEQRTFVEFKGQIWLLYLERPLDF